MKDARETAILLKNTAYNLYRASLCAGPPSIQRLSEELRAPKVGDLVMETTTHLRCSDPLQGIGTLLKITQEPMYTPEAWKESGAGEDETIPEETIYTIRLDFDDDREFRWSNASFIKVKTDLT